MLVYNRSLQEASVIDFRETASALAHRDMFKDNKKKAQKGIPSCFVFSEIQSTLSKADTIGTGLSRPSLRGVCLIESRRISRVTNFKIIMLNLCAVNTSLFKVCFKLFT